MHHVRASYVRILRIRLKNNERKNNVFFSPANKFVYLLTYHMRMFPSASHQTVRTTRSRARFVLMK